MAIRTVFKDEPITRHRARERPRHERETIALFVLLVLHMSNEVVRTKIEVEL